MTGTLPPQETLGRRVAGTHVGSSLDPLHRYDGAPTVLLRLVLPFLRVAGMELDYAALLRRAGLSVASVVQPDTRISHVTLMSMLEAAVSQLGFPALGLRAGEVAEVADFAVVGHIARSSATLRDAIHAMERYTPLLHGALRSRLVEDGDSARWELTVCDGVRQPAAANDFVLASALCFARRQTSHSLRVHELHLAHARATSPVAYKRLFGEVPVRLDMPCNALVLASASLDARLHSAHAELRRAFELRAHDQLAALSRAEGIAGSVRQLLHDGLPTGVLSVGAVARGLTMSEAMLRRRLGSEGTSVTALLDELRCELAVRRLSDSSLSIAEVSYSLGFSHVSGFYKAFRRWHHVTPLTFRARLR